LLNDGTALITGGRDLEDVFDGGGILTAEQFDPATGTFTASGVMTQFSIGTPPLCSTTGRCC
jgi:hypothetical protein